MKKEKTVLLNAFLLGVITGFLLTPLRKGVNVHVENHMLPKGKKQGQ